MKPPPPLKKRMAPPPPASSPLRGGSSASAHGPTPTGLVAAIPAASRKPMPAPRAAAIPPPAASQPRPDRNADTLIGNLLDGRFHVDGVLGEGGMGMVYAGKDGVDGRRVAIKILRSDFLSDSEIVQRFLNEAQAASQIGSPHICSVFGIGSAPNGAAYFVMEFLDGQSLAALLERERVLAIRRILRIGHQIAVGLSAAHASGIIHRDLKPDNIMLVPRGDQAEFAKILDFGVAKIGSSHSKLTRAGSVFGTPQYMSPEQAAGSPVDPRADVYSLGIILYEMAAGMVPFDDENMMNVLTHQMFRDPLAVRDVAPQVVPQEFNAIVRKCLQKDPKLRFESMQALADELERTGSVLPEGQFETVIPDSKRPLSDQGSRGLSATVPELPRLKRSKIGFVVAGVAAALVCCIAGVVAFTQRDSHELSADMAEVTPAAGGPIVAEPRVISLVVRPAFATVTGASAERSKTVVGNEERLVLELAPSAAATLHVTAAGHHDQVIDVSPNLGNSFIVALMTNVPAVAASEPAQGTAAVAAPRKGVRGGVAAPKNPPGPAVGPVAPAGKPCAPRTSPHYDPFGCGAP